VRIRAKILWSLLGMCLLVIVVGARAIGHQRAVGLLETTNEAEEDARVLAYIAAADHGSSHGMTERICRYMYETLGRDVEVVDPQGRVIADSIPAEVGKVTDRKGNALTQTLRDGMMRTYVGTEAGHGLTRLIVVPVTSESGQVLGAVTEEYTPIYTEFMAITEATTRQVIWAALAGIVISVLLALYIGTSIGAPLRQLTRAVVGFAAGESGMSMPEPRNDEIGDLTVAFNVMMERRREVEESLVRALDELARTNEQLSKEVSERSVAEQKAVHNEEKARQLAEELAAERKRLANILDGVPALVFEKPAMEEGHFVSSYVEKMFGYTPAEWLSTPDFWLSRVHPEDRDEMLVHNRALLSGELNGNSDHKKLFRWIARDNRVIWGASYLQVIRDPVTGGAGVRGFLVDVTHQKLAEEELEQLHQQLVVSSREAGMAEVATSVLHNVGNVLNSVNISATVASEQLRQSSVPRLAQAAAFIRENAESLGVYLTTDPVGRKLPAFLDQLAVQLVEENKVILSELNQLGKNVEHIKDIVAVQQSYASSAGVSQKIPVVDLVEDSLRMNKGALLRHDVDLVRQYEAEPVIEVDKHKVMQILVNLIRNAKYACDESERMDKLLTIRITDDKRVVRIEVIDNGVGIPAENLTRIFSHGFTTRKEGHGFGLHSSALAARELGGSLRAQSDGPGCGATFVLELPFRTSEIS